MIIATGLGFILGLILGSLSLALADRSLNNGSFFGRSYCPECKHKLAWYDLFPIFSYLFLKGRCRYCHKKISLQYPLTEALVGVLVAVVFYSSFLDFPGTKDTYQLINFFYNLIFKIFMLVVLVVVAITDLKKTLIPDRITIPSMIIVLTGLLGITAYRIWYLRQSLMSSQMGSYLVTKTDYFSRHSLYAADPLVGSIAMAFIIGAFFMSLILITRGRGMGGGDFKLGILIGLYFGFPNSVSAIILAFLLGSVVAITLVLFGKKHFGQTIAFGPFLSMGAILTIIWSNQLAEFVNNLSLSGPVLPSFLGHF